MTRRPWLAIVVLVLIGIGSTTLVQARTRCDDTLSFAFSDDVAPCEVTPFVAPLAARTAILVDEPPLTALAIEHEVIAIAPKTSPPH